MNFVADETIAPESLAALTALDADLGRVVTQFGLPRVRARAEGFATLVLLILEQQVSLASAEATFARLGKLCDPLTPDTVLAQDDAALRGAGLSRQKARYCRALAEFVTGGDLNLEDMAGHDDDAVRTALVQVPGIGEWTAEIYLLSALGRPDIFPARDLALAVAAQDIKGLQARPDAAALRELGEAWRPWRSLAARILWHHYMHTRRRRDGKAA